MIFASLLIFAEDQSTEIVGCGRPIQVGANLVSLPPAQLAALRPVELLKPNGMRDTARAGPACPLSGDPGVGINGKDYS